jgi:hypothetical protein
MLCPAQGRQFRLLILLIRGAEWRDRHGWGARYRVGKRRSSGKVDQCGHEHLPTPVVRLTVVHRLNLSKGGGQLSEIHSVVEEHRQSAADAKPPTDLQSG